MTTPARRTSLFARIDANLVAHVVAFVAIALFIGTTIYGVGRSTVGGHYGHTASSLGIDGEMILRWGIPGPLTDYAVTKPIPQQYYCHHPWGTSWAQVPGIWLFGHHTWVTLLPGIVQSIVTIFCVFGLARRAWGPIAGAAAVVGFAAPPIALVFANFPQLEVMLMCGCAMFFWGHARLLAMGRMRDLAWSLLGITIAASSDWPAWITLGAVLGWTLLRMYFLPPNASPTFDMRKLGRWWALSTSIAVLMLALWVVFFVKSDKIADWLGAATMRGTNAADKRTLDGVLRARAHWIEICFTPPVILIGKIGAIVAVARLLVLRSDVEMYSLAVLVGSIIQYTAFRGGADVHIFWPHTFVLYFALCFAQIVATIQAGFRRLSRWPTIAAAGPRVALMLVASLFALTLPDGLRVLRFGRETGGRFNEKGNYIRSDIDFTIAAEHFASLFPIDEAVWLHSSLGVSRWHEWALQRPMREVSDGPHGREAPVFITRASYTQPELLKRLASEYHVRAVGDVWLVRPSETNVGIDGFSFAERKPSPIEWYLTGGFEPIRSVVEDPWSTAELRDHFGGGERPPLAEPDTLEHIRIARNLAFADGDAARASALSRKLLASFDQQRGATFSGGLRLLGVREPPDLERRIELLFESAGPIPCEAAFEVKSLVLAPPPFSTIPHDIVERQMAGQMPLHARVWKQGYYYLLRVPLLHRLGKERFSGAFACRASGSPPTRADGAPETELLVSY